MPAAYSHYQVKWQSSKGQSIAHNYRSRTLHYVHRTTQQACNACIHRVKKTALYLQFVHTHANID